MEMLEAALAWCRAGFTVIPVGYDKKPRVAWRELQTEPWGENQVRAWWIAHPHDNIGVIPGSNDYVVIDGDIYKDGGGEALGQFFIDHNLSREGAPMAHTGSGGLHTWYKCVGGVPSGPVSPTIDVKSNGGYVIVPPSANEAGTYKWMTASPLEAVAVTELPGALTSALRERRVAVKKPIQNQVGGAQVIDISLFRATDGREKVMADAVWFAGHRMHEAGLSLDDTDRWAEMAWHRFIEMAKGRGGVPLEVDHGRGELLSKIHSTRAKLKDKLAVVEPIVEQATITIEPWTASDNVDGNAHDFVEGLLTDRGISLWYGPSNTGKTFMVFSLAAHVAMGRQWFGREVAQGRAVYVAAEGVAGIRQRRMALKRHMGAAANDIPLDVVTTGISFLDPAGDIKALVKAIGDARLVVIDTLAAVTAGGDENTSQVMSAVIDCAKQIIAGCGAHVLIVHHQGKHNDQARGHSSLRAGVDTEIHVTSAVAGFGRCKVTKQRDLELSPAFGFQLETVTLGVNRRGREITSCVVKPTELQGEAVELTRDEQVLKTIIANITAGRDPRPITISHSGGPVKCRDHIPRRELVAHYERHAINANRSAKSVRNAFSKAWIGLSHKFGTSNGMTGDGMSQDLMRLSLDNNNLGIL